MIFVNFTLFKDFLFQFTVCLCQQFGRKVVWDGKEARNVGGRICLGYEEQDGRLGIFHIVKNLR